MAKEREPIAEENQQLRDVLSQLKQARLVQQVFVGLGKELSLGTTQEYLKLVVGTLQALFGEAYFLVQLADPKTLVPNAVEYRGPLKPGAAEKLPPYRRGHPQDGFGSESRTIAGAVGK